MAPGIDGAHDLPALLGPLVHQPFLRMERDLVTVPNSPGDMTESVVMNPSAIGNPDETPRVFVGSALAKLLGRCGQPLPNGRDCGGVNGFHSEGCADA